MLSSTGTSGFSNEARASLFRSAIGLRPIMFNGVENNGDLSVVLLV